MRVRSGVVIIESHAVVLIKRMREGQVYYVFPGGGVEKEETPKEAAKREAYEELGLEVEVGELLKKVEFNGLQFYFQAKIVAGTFGTGAGEEYRNERNRGTYEPVWLPLSQLGSVDIRPKELGEELMKRITD
ncbi:DNA mismatch repair protein MutT [Alkalihalobacillus alcalophilus ATCC 27647 = CGMCC 1.3604]|uniref:DNA mismatch repair protein MutT n=1 Tax=Alkalihalobacillus alcalophilus ATCC 27647 = CGMCC 1.3604 TaxID=1218173 RepID=A0A094WDP5_ALKAL|nr:NUDIX domain-containing protein [Alkalihalobacillus alcalophilus]KGA95869.1 DNA mismatch repair protein MutT [Alkalihalobacillus alcalophilus ATCC 27647 = CGMCC 1.3604]MED1563974.1 NUDIX domain-containing protein [Alkalihalobacillus alcalophilus]THG92107.1 DNA mismatch repair protein MutT [Alkalihalobacillus alcalophilus ATCC 27647 = CGMCC 1.3604]